MPSLEQKKRLLEEKRNFYKPIEKKELVKHAERYEKIKQENNEVIRRNRME